MPCYRVLPSISMRSLTPIPQKWDNPPTVNIAIANGQRYMTPSVVAKAAPAADDGSIGLDASRAALAIKTKRYPAYAQKRKPKTKKATDAPRNLDHFSTFLKGFVDAADCVCAKTTGETPDWNSERSKAGSICRVPNDFPCDLRAESTACFQASKSIPREVLPERVGRAA